MSGNDIASLLRVRPFEPFNLVCSDGTAYRVDHPELVVPALASVIVGYPDPHNPGVAVRFDVVSMRHIVRLEPLGQATQTGPQGNGPAS
jgi:hypothetical protein